MGKGIKFTRTDEKMLDFIRTFMVENGYPPTIREICKGLGYSSAGSAHEHFEKLKELGYITVHDKRYSVKGMKYVQVDDKSSSDMPCM